MATKKTQGKNTGATKKLVAARKSKTGTRSSFSRDSDEKSERTTQPVAATIKRGDTGPQVIVLQDALFALLKCKAIQPRQSPNLPTKEELEKLSECLKKERAQSLFGEATLKLVIYFQVQRGLGDNLEGVVEEKTAAKINEVLKSECENDDDNDGDDDEDPADPTDPKPIKFVVRGHIAGASSGQFVRAYDQDFRSQEILGNSPIDPQGNYKICYTADRFMRAESGGVEKGRADLRVAVCESGDQEVASSEIHFNAVPNTTIDLVVGAIPAELSEYERYLAYLEPVLEGVALIDIDGGQPKDKERDLAFLAGDTGIDLQHIVWLVQAAKLAADVRVPPAGAINIPAEAFYGWFRQGMPTELAALQVRPISTLRKTLLDAIDENIVPHRLRDEVENILARVPNPQARELAILLGVTALPEEKIKVVLAQADGVEAISDEVLARLVTQKSLTEPEAQSLGLGVSLHRLAVGNQTLVSTMLGLEFPSVNTGKLRQARDLALLGSEDWERVLVKAGAPLPEGMPRADYARSLAMEAASAFPHAAFVYRATHFPIGISDQLKKIQPLLEKNNEAITHEFEALDLAGVNDADREVFQDAHTSLKRLANRHPGLGLHEVFSQQDGTVNPLDIVGERMGWLRTVFDLNPEVNFLGLDYLPDSPELKMVKFGELSEEARDRVLVDLKAHQRIYSVANNPIAALEIMQAGFHSASAIALARAPDFVRSAGLPVVEARSYYDAARERANEAALRWFKLNEVARDTTMAPVRVIPSLNEFFSPLKGFAELLNNQPWCACAHCQSVLSPAAYFVDLMYYIEVNILKDSFNNGRERHPLHLQVRRPDLWYDLELTCKNTNEYVPYLDVVNEILERYITDTISIPVGTTVYKHLAEQDGSFKQPFSLPIERLEILLGHFGLSRYDVAKAMGSDRRIQARVRLNISQKEYDLITIARTSTDDLVFFKQLFKVNSPNSIASPDTVFVPMEMKTFLHATGLAHEIVEAVLKTKFVNADGSTNARIEVVIGKRVPDDVQNNSELVKYITLRRLDRIHRFVRLWRKLPWTVAELDYVLMRLAVPDQISRIDAGMPATATAPGKAGTLEKILDLLDLNAEWLLPVDELMALSDMFPTTALRGPTSLFTRLFNQPPFVDRDAHWPPAEGPFVHPAWRKKDNSQGFSDPSNNTLTRLLAGLQVDDRELVKLIESLAPAIGYQSATTTTDESILLSEKSLGILYRHARLMRLLKLPITDFVKLIKLTPRIQVRVPAEQYIRDLDDVASIVEFVVWQKASGFSPDEIIYVTDVAGGASPEGALDPVVLASQIVALVKTETSLDFADTVFTQIGLTDLQSRKLVLDNTTTPTNDKAFVKLQDGSTYRLLIGYDPSDAQTIPLTIDAAIDDLSVRSLLRKYHFLSVLDVFMAGALQMAREEVEVIRVLALPVFGAPDIAAIAKALQGDPDRVRLTALIKDMLRFRTLFKSRVFNVKSLSFVGKNRAVFFGLPGDPTNQAITAHVVRNVAAYVALATVTDADFTTAADSANIDALHNVIDGVGPPVSEEDYAKTLRTDKARIGALKPHLITLPSNPFDALAVLARCLVLTEQLGVSGETLSLMIKEGPSSSATFDRLSRVAEDVFGAFRAKYPEEKTFQEKMEPFEDKFRTRKRDGLVDFIVSKWPEPFADPNKLYEYFLIDVLLEGCARTSRVVAAISSLQLYVHRVLMNLEKSADLILYTGTNEVFQGVMARFNDSEKKNEWYWRENYRVWEANRKVFLYPENYIEPELRDDKTPLFKEIEDTLLQQEISDSNVHDAYAKYLTGFDEVAHLKIAGAYYSEGADELHLFGVTQDAPIVYYYRAIKNTRSAGPGISAWQKLSLQIPVKKVSPILFEERLYIFWLETTTRPLSKFVEGSSKFGGYQHSVRIKYSALRLDGAWSSPQSLRFEKDGATEDSRIIKDPKTEDEGATARRKSIKDLEEKIPNLKITENTKAREAKEAGDVWGTAKSKSADALWLANHPQDWFWPPDTPRATTKLADVTEWIMGKNHLLTGYTNWFDFGAKWLLANPGWIPSAGTPPVLSLMARDATKIIEDGARKAWEQAETARQRAADAVVKAEIELETLGRVVPARVAVRWDKSMRDHTEPLDNYKPEGWEWDRVYPEVYSLPNLPKSLRLMFSPRDAQNVIPTSDEVDLPSGVLRQVPPTDREKYVTVTRISTFPGRLILINITNDTYKAQAFYVAAFWLNYLSGTVETTVAYIPESSDLQVVNGGDLASVIIESKGDMVWMRKMPAGLYLGTQLGTTLTATLTKEFGHYGASTLLEAGFQQLLNERPSNISPVAGQSDPEMRNPFHPTNPYLTYFRETFFHIPFLVANHLNSQQKFAQTQRWYHYIFNPTAADREPWRYREFRNLASQSLRMMLTDKDALAVYRKDPFNPHAIARTRLSAYQKSIVMKYIDNLLDWGDSLFSQFTMESVNEATMLYVMAQDILGPRPSELGSCGEGEAFGDRKKTYYMIRPELTEVSDFLIELESPSPSLGYHPTLEGEAGRRVIASMQPSMQASTVSAGSPPASAPISIAEVGTVSSLLQPSVAGRTFNEAGGGYWTNVGGTPLKDLYNGHSLVGNGGSTILGTDTRTPRIPGNRTGNIDFGNPNSGSGGGKFGVRDGDQIKLFDRIPPLEVKYGLRNSFNEKYPLGFIVPEDFTPPKVNPVEAVPPKNAVFCIPPNKDLLAYWGRVEDRLFKVRNCMDIGGIRRRLELFAPEIDPRFLVRMKAAGLTLDDVLNSTSGNLPPYRFTYLIEKAKQHAGTLQSFGSQLLSAIEKRDGEELGLLRAVHEQNLLKMRSRMMQLEIDAAEDALEGLRRQKAAAEYRRGYFYSLSDVGLLASESKQQQLQREASNYRTQAGLAQVVASILTIIPDVGAPTAMKFGGSQLGAAGRAVADGLNALAAFNEMGASMAGMESSNRRRDQDWKHQVETAKRDVSQIEKQITAAEIRRDIAVHSLKVHDKTVDQSEELFDFFGTKFSSFGRYTLLSTRLHKLYRQAFNSALSMGKMAEQAYRAERTDDDTLLDGKYWDADNAGLLAGERLLIDLQGLERQYIEKNYRQLEVEQSFSLAQFAPDRLATLRLTGGCTFNIPEWFFDLTYPGQYRRRLKAVRLTIPSVTGPYTNVGATLHLENSQIRLATELPGVLTTVPLRHTVTIAASKAQYDAGVFDFSFRDERYMPFEGAGAISTWQLSLPKTLRVFDYGTISDVIVHLSYTADFDGLLKENIEKEAEGIILELKKPQSMARSFSLRHEFPDVFHQLSTSPLGTEVGFNIEPRHFPFFLIGRSLKADAASLRVLSPLNQIQGARFTIKEKGSSLQGTVSPGPATPAPEVIGQGMREFNLGSVLGIAQQFSGIASGLTGNYVIQITAAGPMGPNPSYTGMGAIDPSNLHDIVLKIGYCLAPA